MCHQWRVVLVLTPLSITILWRHLWGVSMSMTSYKINCGLYCDTFTCRRLLLWRHLLAASIVTSLVGCFLLWRHWSAVFIATSVVGDLYYDVNANTCSFWREELVLLLFVAIAQSVGMVTGLTPAVWLESTALHRASHTCGEGSEGKWDTVITGI